MRKAEQITAQVKRQYFIDGKKPNGQEQVTNELIEVRTFVTEPAKVGLNMGITLNLGNFESARIDVSLHQPCYAEEKDAAFTNARQWVEDRLRVEIGDVQKNKPNLF